MGGNVSKDQKTRALIINNWTTGDTQEHLEIKPGKPRPSPVAKLQAKQAS